MFFDARDTVLMFAILHATFIAMRGVKQSNRIESNYDNAVGTVR